MLTITPISETALVCVLPPPAELSKQQRLWAFADLIATATACQEVVVGMNNVTVFTAPDVVSDDWVVHLQDLWRTNSTHQHQGQHIQIPVVYGGECGMDLWAVAQFHGVDPQTIVQWHTAPVYTVFCMGFQAGFPYLGGLPAHLHTPRRAVPRKEVEAGSVGIGGSQTGVYPFASPAGWQIIGQTQLALFQAQSEPPTLLCAGDTVQFVVERIES